MWAVSFRLRLGHESFESPHTEKQKNDGQLSSQSQKPITTRDTVF